MTLEVIRIGGLELRFLQSKESSEGSLDSVRNDRGAGRPRARRAFS
jgi:hypothetical protein